MKVEFYRHKLGDKNIDRLARVCRTLFLTTGPETKKFEEHLAGYLERKHVVGLTSATAALHLSLLALGVGPGDEVVTTPLTFAATGLAVCHTGARPVFVDVEPGTGNMDISKVPQALTGKTKALLPVHLYGQMIDMVGLKKIADSHGLPIIEDAAHCLEGARDGIRVGELSRAACFSFYATKSITSGEGGAVSVDDPDLARLIIKLRTHGMTTDAADRYTKAYRHYDIDEEGWKYNMSDLQAALLMDQLDEIEANRSARVDIASLYRESLADLPGLELPVWIPEVKHCHHLFTVWVDPLKRDEILLRLQEEGVGVAVNYRVSHLYTLFREKFGYKEGDFPVAEEIGSRTISLPLYPTLSRSEVEYVVSTLGRIMRESG